MVPSATAIRKDSVNCIENSSINSATSDDTILRPSTDSHPAEVLISVGFYECFQTTESKLVTSERKNIVSFTLTFLFIEY